MSERLTLDKFYMQHPVGAANTISINTHNQTNSFVNSFIYKTTNFYPKLFSFIHFAYIFNVPFYVRGGDFQLMLSVSIYVSRSCVMTWRWLGLMVETIFHINKTIYWCYQVFFIYPTECTTKLFYIKTYITIYIKILLHVSVTKPSSGSLLPCFAKVIIIKIIS
jgi:hypothetical protein